MTARSKRQREILNFLTEFLEIKGYSPSYKEIADGLGLSSKGSVARHIETLEAQGFLDRIRDENGFTLRLKSDSSGGCRHFPIGWHREPLGDESPKQAPALTSDALGPFEPERLSAFEIEDDSLSGDGIKEGDIVFVELRSLATEGEIVKSRLSASFEVYCDLSLDHRNPARLISPFGKGMLFHRHTTAIAAEFGNSRNERRKF